MALNCKNQYLSSALPIIESHLEGTLQIRLACGGAWEELSGLGNEVERYTLSVTLHSLVLGQEEVGGEPD